MLQEGQDHCQPLPGTRLNAPYLRLGSPDGNLQLGVSHCGGHDATTVTVSFIDFRVGICQSMHCSSCTSIDLLQAVTFSFVQHFPPLINPK